jgi:hypothetical protein
MLAALLMVVSSALVWVFITRAGGRSEAWDSELYWKLGQPILLTIALAIGAALSANPWAVGAGNAAGQSLALLAGSSGDFGLLPLGLLVLGILSLGSVLAAYIGARLRRALLG